MSEPRLIRLSHIRRFDANGLVNLNLFDGEAFFGRLLCLEPGQQVPVHTHEHKDECFDVVEGEGTLLAGGQEYRAGPGTTLYVPAHVRHGLRADGPARWVLRETVNERVYARRALALAGRAILKRLKLARDETENQ
ncbi:MAG: cupin domain-containing protein [Rudaea sp.]